MTEVQRLIGCPGVDINYALSDGRTGLWRAAYEGHLEVVKLLLSVPEIDVNQAKTTTGATPLFMASQKGHDKVVKALLADHRVDPNIRRKGGTKNNAVNVAAFYGHLEVVKLLLRCPKVNLGVENKYGVTELDSAKEQGHWDIVNAIQSRQSLLQEGHTC